tara:strand:+ start:199 stop:402 length:204 start_codon:yes stop_codon:yes gene_type:complete
MRRKIMDKDTEELYDYLMDYEIATEKEISLVCSINGTNLDSLESILYSRTGYRSLEQIRMIDDEEDY